MLRNAVSAFTRVFDALISAFTRVFDTLISAFTRVFDTLISAFTRVFDTLWYCAADPGSTPLLCGVPALRRIAEEALRRVRDTRLFQAWQGRLWLSQAMPSDRFRARSPPNPPSDNPAC